MLRAADKCATPAAANITSESDRDGGTTYRVAGGPVISTPSASGSGITRGTYGQAIGNKLSSRTSSHSSSIRLKSPLGRRRHDQIHTTTELDRLPTRFALHLKNKKAGPSRGSQARRRPGVQAARCVGEVAPQDACPAGFRRVWRFTVSPPPGTAPATPRLSQLVG